MSTNVPKASAGKVVTPKRPPPSPPSVRVSPQSPRPTPKIPARPVGMTGQKRVTGIPGKSSSDRQERRSYTENKICCGPPASNPFLPCQEIKKSVNYGTRPEIPAREPCEHVHINNPGCEKCCKTITINKYVVSLHCGWHHECLRCSWCKETLDDDHKVFRGIPYCENCHTRLVGDHASDLRTVHKGNQ